VQYNKKRGSRFAYWTNIISISLIMIILVMLFFVWKDIYVQQYNIPHFITAILMCLMALKFIFDVSMVLIFIYLVNYFNKKRNEKRVASKLNSNAHALLKWEAVVVIVFVVFYIIRVFIMDFGYAFLVGLYFVD
jgi:hypothetical protein